MFHSVNPPLCKSWWPCILAGLCRLAFISDRASWDTLLSICFYFPHQLAEHAQQNFNLICWIPRPLISPCHLTLRVPSSQWELRPSSIPPLSRILPPPVKRVGVGWMEGEGTRVPGPGEGFELQWESHSLGDPSRAE